MNKYECSIDRPKRPPVPYNNIIDISFFSLRKRFISELFQIFFYYFFQLYFFWSFFSIQQNILRQKIAYIIAPDFPPKKDLSYFFQSQNGSSFQIFFLSGHNLRHSRDQFLSLYCRNPLYRVILPVEK